MYFKSIDFVFLLKPTIFGGLLLRALSIRTLVFLLENTNHKAVRFPAEKICSKGRS